MERQTRLIALLLAGTGVLTACQTAKRNEELAYVERPVEQLYLTGTDAMERGRYDDAILYFNEVERQHPYSEWASRAQIMTAFTAYEARRYDEAITAARRYIELHPGNDETAYANYLIAICYFEQIVDVGRDQGTTEFAKSALTDVIRGYPDSDYAKDAQLKLDMVNDQLAGKELAIGRWYLRNNQALAAINRFRTVVTDYPTTSHSPEALYRMVEGYLTLGLVDEAQETAAVLGYNHPGSDWYADAYTLVTGQGASLDVIPAGQRRKFLGVF